MTYRCESCRVNWAAYQTRAGVCVQCRGGTTRVLHEDPDSDAAELHRAALAREARVERSRRLREEFEVFYAERERRRAA